MSKRNLILISIIIFIIIVLIVVVNRKSINKTINENNTISSVQIMQDSENETYVVYDEDGSVLIETENQAEAEFYQMHPDFNPMIPVEQEEWINTTEAILDAEKNINIEND